MGSRLFAIVAAICLATSASAQTFSDVPLDHWAYNYIETLAASGITAGCGGGKYCPLGQVTRAQMAVFLERGMRGSDFWPPAAKGNVFIDVGATDFAASYIEQLYLDGVTGGCGGGKYCPTATVTRAQMAVFLLRAKHGQGYSPPPATGMFLDVPLNYWAVHWIEQLAREGITGGCDIDYFCPDGAVTRDQMAVFLMRTFATHLSGVLPAKTYPAGLYILAGRTDVAPRTTVVFSAGSQIIGQGNQLRVFGTLRAVGSAGHRVHIDDVHISPYSQTIGDRFRIELSWCDMRYGSFYFPTGNAIYGSFSVTDCRLTQLPDMYLWYPEDESEFLRNVFTNCAPISVLLDGRYSATQKLTIASNRFSGVIAGSYFPASAIHIIEVYDPPSLTIKGNSFLDVGQRSIALDVGGYTRRLIDATDNYWGTNDPSVVAQMVFDETDDLAAPGIITVSPYLVAPGPGTPTR